MQRQLSGSKYRIVDHISKEINECLSILIDQRMLGVQVFAEGTWHFYFGRGNVLSPDESGTTPYLGVECSWRIQKGGAILIGSDDYDVLEKSANRQINAVRAIIAGEGIPVASIRADELGGFAITFETGHVLEIFPASATEMAWIFRCPAFYSLILMNGVLNKRGPGTDGDLSDS